MYLKIDPKNIADTYSTPILQQTSFWSGVKSRLGVDSSAFDFSIRNSELYTNVGGYAQTQADVVVFYQPFNKEDYIAYLPYGPEVEPSVENQGVFLEEFSEELRRFLPKNCVGLRYDLNWRSHWCDKGDFDEYGNWIGLPDIPFQEFQLNYGTNNWNLKKAYTNVLPSNTILIDISGDEDEILNRMKPKTRYNIKLSMRKGVEVREMGLDAMDVWYKLYTETALRNGLTLNDMSYFESILSSKIASDEVDVKLLVAFLDKKPLAAIFLVLSSHRATYLYGASTAENRNVMPTYALQWEAIRIAKKYDCIEYDMFGVAPTPDPNHPMHGLYKFKKGFGGEIYHQLGCWDYPFEEDKYKYFRAMEMNMQGYYTP